MCRSLGIVENMSYFLSPSDGKRYEIFGSGGGAMEAKRFKVPLLGAVPLDIETREAGDRGMPVVFEKPHHPISQVFRKNCRSTTQERSKSPLES